MKSHYEVLGVSYQATDEEIRKAYRQMARDKHPDRNPGNESEAAVEFHRIQSAYETLIDHNKHADYDRNLQGSNLQGTATGDDCISESIDPEIVLRLAESRKKALEEIWDMVKDGKSKKEIVEKVSQIISVHEKRENLDAKIIDMVQAGKNLTEIIKQLDQTKSSFVKIRSSVNVLEEDLKKHQRTVRITKGVGATAGVVGAGLFFTPLAPVAIAGILIGSVASFTGLGVSIGDIVITRKAKIQIQNDCKTVQEELRKLNNSLKALEYTDKTPSNFKAYVGEQIRGAFGAFRIGRVGDLLFMVDDIVGIGSNAAKVIGPALAAVGAGFSAIDAVITAVNENQAIGEAHNLQSDLKDSIKAIEDITELLKKEMKMNKKRKQNVINGSDRENMLTYQASKPGNIGIMLLLLLLYVYVFIYYG